MKDMKEIQEKITKFCKENKIASPVEHRVLDIMSELGELSKEILKIGDYGKKPVALSEEIKLELGDLFFSIIVMANSLNIDLEDALNIVLDKYSKRSNKGSIGSDSN